MLKRPGRGNPIALLRRLPAALRLLVVTQFAFNVGFYLVVPFLAAHLAQDLALAGWAVGLILGLRTFCQQGLFFLGGALADRFGVKQIILIGVVVRIAGFVGLGLARDPWSVTAGVALIGFAAALFSPAVESALTVWAGELEAKGGPRRTEVIGLEVMAAKMGTIVGPLLGGILLVVPFEATCFVAAGVFGVILLAQLRWLPAEARASAPSRVGSSLRDVLANRHFLLFALIHCTYLLSYNQLYLAIPVELERIGAPSANITWLFALAAIVVLVLQLPISRAVARWRISRVLGWGYALITLGFLGVAGFAPLTPLPGVLSYLPSALFVVGLHLGQILVLPAARAAVADLAGGQRMGTYLGMLASIGGAAVLVGSTAIGFILPLSAEPSGLAPVPWLALAAVSAASTLGVVAFCRRRSEPTPTKGKR